MTTAYWLTQLLNALQYSMLLFVLSVGLTVVFGLMNFVNLAHGTFYALGAFVGWSLLRITGSFWAALVGAPLVVAAIAALLYLVMIARMQRAGHLAQVLATLGLVFVGVEVMRMIWGDFALEFSAPPALAGSVSLFGLVYPAYRLFVIALGLVALVLLWLLLERTALGAMIRAAVDNAAMASALGVRVDRLFFAMFCFGCALAALAGVVAAPIFSVYPGMGIEILIPTLIVVVVGGLGSLRGAVAGSLLVGFVDTFGQVLLPQLSGIVVYALLALTLLLRPQGLFPARA